MSSRHISHRKDPEHLNGCPGLLQPVSVFIDFIGFIGFAGLMILMH